MEKIEVKVDGRDIDVTLKEFEFLKYLALKEGQAVTREELLKMYGNMIILEMKEQLMY